MTCLNCNNMMQSGDAFCVKCGKPNAGAAEKPAPLQPAQPTQPLQPTPPAQPFQPQQPYQQQPPYQQAYQPQPLHQPFQQPPPQQYSQPHNTYQQPYPQPPYQNNMGIMATFPDIIPFIAVIALAGLSVLMFFLAWVGEPSGWGDAETMGIVRYTSEIFDSISAMGSYDGGFAFGWFMSMGVIALLAYVVPIFNAVAVIMLLVGISQGAEQRKKCYTFAQVTGIVSTAISATVLSIVSQAPGLSIRAPIVLLLIISMLIAVAGAVAQAVTLRAPFNGSGLLKGSGVVYIVTATMMLSDVIGTFMIIFSMEIIDYMPGGFYALMAVRAIAGLWFLSFGIAAANAKNITFNFAVANCVIAGIAIAAELIITQFFIEGEVGYLISSMMSNDGVVFRIFTAIALAAAAAIGAFFYTKNKRVLNNPYNAGPYGGYPHNF